MSRLQIFNEDEQNNPILVTEDFSTIVSELKKIGVCLERWKANKKLNSNATNEEILDAYQAEINKLVRERGYQSWDVISMHPEHPEKNVFRKKFLSEHTHTEDEVRFFVDGEGLFTLHSNKKVYAMLCTKDDLISVPAKTKHWFDMGPNPSFTAIRLFDNPEGWIANFTGDDIASGFPLLVN